MSDEEPRPCPVCASTDESHVLADARLDGGIEEISFAARKIPEHRHLRLVRCPVCDVAYASPAPAEQLLLERYEVADFDAGVEGRYAATTYGRLVDAELPRLPGRTGALDIGTGDGAFLHELLDRGFDDVVGIEPSEAPVAGADARVAPHIRRGAFGPDSAPRGSQSLVTCFQTIEHLADPLGAVSAARDLLRPGGALLIVCHDRDAAANRLMGHRSPIFDVEHLQLFNRGSVRALLERAGFADVSVTVFRNRYPLGYWLRLAPLPGAVKRGALERVRDTRLGRVPITLPVGNLVARGRVA